MSNWVEVNVNWTGDMHFSGQNSKGASVEMGSVGDKPGVSPMEMLLFGLAGCTGMDVVHILRKKKMEPEDFRLTVRAKRAEEHPKVYTEIELTYLLWGDNLTDKAVQDAIRLSEEKYCSASAMLSKTANITIKYKINPDTYPLD